MADTIGTIAKWLVVIGGLNWGLVGIGGFAKANLNVINLLVGKIAALESVIYLLVGVSALYMLWGMFKK